MSTRVEKVVIREPPQAPNGEVLFEIVRGPISGSPATGISYTEWRIYVPKDEVDALFKEHHRIVQDERQQEYYEGCITSGLSLKAALKKTETHFRKVAL
jgi:hypothetical protein